MPEALGEPLGPVRLRSWPANGGGGVPIRAAGVAHQSEAFGIGFRALGTGWVRTGSRNREGRAPVDLPRMPDVARERQRRLWRVRSSGVWLLAREAMAADRELRGRQVA